MIIKMLLFVIVFHCCFSTYPYFYSRHVLIFKISICKNFLDMARCWSSDPNVVFCYHSCNLFIYKRVDGPWLLLPLSEIREILTRYQHPRTDVTYPRKFRIDRLAIDNPHVVILESWNQILNHIIMFYLTGDHLGCPSLGENPSSPNAVETGEAKDPLSSSPTDFIF